MKHCVMFKKNVKKKHFTSGIRHLDPTMHFKIFSFSSFVA